MIHQSIQWLSDPQRAHSTSKSHVPTQNILTQAMPLPTHPPVFDWLPHPNKDRLAFSPEDIWLISWPPIMTPPSLTLMTHEQKIPQPSAHYSSLFSDNTRIQPPQSVRQKNHGGCGSIYGDIEGDRDVGYNKSMNYDYLTSTVKVSIPNFSESKTEPGTIFFNLQLQAKDNKWFVEKRFSEFDQLYNGLKNTYHSLPVLPKKSFLFKMTEKELEARRAGLEEFLRKIVVRNDLMNSELVKQFLQLDKNASEVMVNPPKLHLEYSVEGQTKGIRDYTYVEEQNLFLVVTADQSPVNRLNAKVTNTKMPWENEGGKFMEVGTVEAWQCDMESAKFVKVWSKGYPQQALCLYYDRASRKLLVGLDDGVVDFIQVKEAGYDDLVCDKIHSNRITGLGYDSLTNVVFSVSQDKIFRISHGSSLALVLGVPHKEQLLAMYKDNINKRAFIGNKIGEILIYDISHAEKPKLLTTLRNNKGGSIRCLNLDTSRNYLFTGSFEDGEINVFDLDKPGREKLAKLSATLIGKEKIRAIAWSSKRAEIMTGTADGSITFWNAVQGKSIYVLQAFDAEVTQLTFLPDKEWLVSSSKAKSIKIWSMPKEWRDARLVAAEIKDAGKTMNEYRIDKLKNTMQKAQEDSDDDDLAGWHLD